MQTPEEILGFKQEIAANQKTIDELNARLHRKTDEIRIIQIISDEINATLDLDRIFDIILTAMDSLFGFQHALILLKTQDQDQLEVVASRGYEEGGIGAVVPFGQGVIGVVAKKRKTMRMGAIASQARYLQIAGTQSGHVARQVTLPGLKDVKSQIAIPLVVKEDLIGVFAVESNQQNAFQLLDELILGIVGNQIGAAIANARAYRIVEDLTHHLEERVVERTLELQKEREKSERLLLNVLPPSIAEELKAHGTVEPRHYDSVSVLFTDFVGFTSIAADMAASDLVRELDGCFSAFDAIAGENHLEKLKTIGDSYMCAGGVPKSNATHALDACLAGLAFLAFIEELSLLRKSQGKPAWALRLGIHTGSVTAGVIGKEKFAYDVWGDTVNTASRMESAGMPGRVNISENTYNLVKDFFLCSPRGKIETKGKGFMEMFLVDRIRPEFSADARGLTPGRDFLERRSAMGQLL